MYFGKSITEKNKYTFEKIFRTGVTAIENKTIVNQKLVETCKGQ